MHECFERNSSAQNGSKASCKREAYPYLRGTVPYRTVPKSHVSAALEGEFLISCERSFHIFSLKKTVNVVELLAIDIDLNSIGWN